MISREAEKELERLDSVTRRATIAAIEKKRREEAFIRYWKPYPKQGEALAEFTSEIKIFTVLGGNRSGKTELGAVIAVAWALGKKFFEGEPAYEILKNLPIPDPPNNIWVVGLDFPTLRDVIWGQKLRSGRDHPPILPQMPGLVTPRDGDFQAKFENGSMITCKSADSGPDKFQGASVDLVWIDEEPEEAVFNECYQRTIDCAGKILVTLTPLTDINSGVRTPWVFDLYEDWKRGAKDLRFVSLSMLDNPFIPEAEKEKAKAKWSGHYEEGARLFGHFIRRSGLVYPMWDATRHLIRPFDIPRNWPRYVSIDPSVSGITAAVWAAISPQDDIYIYREYYEKDMVISDHAKNLLIRNAGDPVDVWLIDPFFGRQKTQVQHKTNSQLYRESGLPVREPSVGDDYGLNASREYLQAAVDPAGRNSAAFIFEGLEAFRSEIEHYIFDFFQSGEQKGQSKEKPRKGHDHLMNAFQYLCSVRPRGSRRTFNYRSQREQLKDLQNNSYTDITSVTDAGHQSDSQWKEFVGG